MGATLLIRLALVAALCSAGQTSEKSTETPGGPPLEFVFARHRVAASGERDEHVTLVAELTTLPGVTDRAVAEIASHTIETVRSRPPFNNEVYAPFWEAATEPEFIEADHFVGSSQKNQTHWKLPAADQTVAEALVRALLSGYVEIATRHFQDEIRELEAQRAEYESQVDEPKREYERAKQAVVDMQLDTVSIDVVKQRLSDLKAELRGTELDLAELNGQLKSFEERIPEVRRHEHFQYFLDLNVKRDGKLARQAFLTERMERYQKWQLLVSERNGLYRRWNELQRQVNDTQQSIDALKERLDALQSRGVEVYDRTVVLSTVYRD